MVELFPEGFEEVDVADDLELAAFAADAPDRLAELGTVTADDVLPGWEDVWKRFHHPVRIGQLWVGPPWEPPDGDALALVIDPGRAFGTGAHATTRLCLELLLTCARGSLVDLGCGSGILAIAGAKLGFSPVTALDSDPAAVEAARANAGANEADIDVRAADIVEDALPDADVAVANVDLATAGHVAQRVTARHLIVSGYLPSEWPSTPGWRHRERRASGAWAADLFEAGESDAA